MKRKAKEKIQEQTPESKSQCIKLQLKGMIETLYMRTGCNTATSPLLVSSVGGVSLGAAMVYERAQWGLYVDIAGQAFVLHAPEPYWLYKQAMEILS